MQNWVTFVALAILAIVNFFFLRHLVTATILKCKAVGWPGSELASASDDWRVPYSPPSQKFTWNENLLENPFSVVFQEASSHFPTQNHGKDIQWQMSKGKDKAAGRERSLRDWKTFDNIKWENGKVCKKKQKNSHIIFPFRDTNPVHSSFISLHTTPSNKG